MSEPQTPSGRALLRDWVPDATNDHERTCADCTATRHEEHAEASAAVVRIEAEARDAILDALEAAVLGITGIRAVQGVRFDGLMVNQAAVLEEIKKLRRQP